MFLKGIIYVCLSLVTGTFCQDEGPVVGISSGLLQGFSAADRFERTYDVFLGVPFARPPVGNLRWQPAQRPEEPWEGIRNATEFAAHCIQVPAAAYSFLGMGDVDSEDCLYLNVYVPVSVDDALTKNLPVMFYFYGGAYLLGTAEMYPGQELATEKNVLVVTTTYRTSIMGFLSTGDSAAPGNYALWDGKAGLGWTIANIAAFGGNPNNITVFGHSAGAGMTMHSVLSSQTNNLFQKAIAISGSGTGVTSFNEDPMRSTQHVADLFFCNTTDSQEIVDCLRGKDAKTLDTLGLSSILGNESRIPNFMPVIDGDFIVQDTRLSMEQGAGSHIPLITGHTVHDGAAFALSMPLGAPAQWNFTRLNRTSDGNRDNQEIRDYIILMTGNTDDPDAMYELLLERYPDLNSSDPEVCSRVATDITTYWFFSAAAHYEAEYHARAAGAGTFLYRFEHRQSFLTGYPPWVNGSHMDDIYAVLGDPFMKPFRETFLDKVDFSADDELVSSNVRGRFTNFAYTGDPNLGPSAVSTTWPDYGSGQFLVQATEERLDSLSAAELEEIDWFLNVWWPLLKPDTWGPEAGVDREDRETRERRPIDEEEFLSNVEQTRFILYQYCGFNDDIMEEIDTRIVEALLDRERYRP